MAKFDFEWAISDPVGPNGDFVFVRERLIGHDQHNMFGPMRKGVADSFIKARRSYVHRRITTRFAAMQLFEQRPARPTRNLLYPEHKARQ